MTRTDEIKFKCLELAMRQPLGGGISGGYYPKPEDVIERAEAYFAWMIPSRAKAAS